MHLDCPIELASAMFLPGVCQMSFRRDAKVYQAGGSWWPTVSSSMLVGFAVVSRKVPPAASAAGHRAADWKAPSEEAPLCGCISVPCRRQSGEAMYAWWREERH